MMYKVKLAFRFGEVSERSRKWYSTALFCIFYVQLLYPALFAFGNGSPLFKGMPVNYMAKMPFTKMVKKSIAVAANKRERASFGPPLFNDFNHDGARVIDEGEKTYFLPYEGSGGPSQPEHTQFKPAGAQNLVDLFTGDFAYNIPLMDVGGYPISINYAGGITMDQEASWVGLGWNINPGVVSRNSRGIPDDFNGKDSIISTVSMKDFLSMGASLSMSFELAGIKLNPRITQNLTYNNRTGIGLGIGINAAVDLLRNNQVGMGGAGVVDSSAFARIGAGINLSNMEGATFAPSFSYLTAQNAMKERGGSVSLATNFNSRAGLYDLTLDGAPRVRNAAQGEAQKRITDGIPFSSSISFAKEPPFPHLAEPYTTINGVFTLNLGPSVKVAHFGNGSISGHYSKTFIDELDKTVVRPAYGYLHFSKYASDKDLQSVADFGREKETYYRDQPLPSNIGVPSYNFDVFSVSGEGTGGMFRAYRTDAGILTDHYMKSKSQSLSGGIDLGIGAGDFKFGANVAITSLTNTSQNWEDRNGLLKHLLFANKADFTEPVYFKNPGELVASNKALDEFLGKEDLIKFKLKGIGASGAYINPVIESYSKGKKTTESNLVGTIAANERVPRSQFIKYYTSLEASNWFSNTIVSYDTNYFHIGCSPNTERIRFVNRVDSFVHKPNHLSAIALTQPDGKIYEYGIPVYSLETKEVSYSLSRSTKTDENNLAYSMDTLADFQPLRQRFLGYKPDDLKDNTTEQYFNRVITPAHANSFLLTGIYSSDYLDVTLDGPSEDDRGDAIKFKYSQLHYEQKAGGYGWKTPFNTSSTNGMITANVNEGLKTDYRDDKANFVFGRKEVWYLNSVESKTMVANFYVEGRQDGYGIGKENGSLDLKKGLCRLKEIRLYAKADFAVNGEAATPVKVVHFEYDYSLCPGVPGERVQMGGKLTLRKIWFTYNGNEKGQRTPYKFDYRNNLPYKRQSSDSWGYYKDATDNPGGLGNKDYPYAVNDYAKAAKDVNIAPWALCSITTPNGSKIKVTYEADDYGFVQNKRAAQLFEVLKMGKSSDFNAADNRLYEDDKDVNDHNYLFISVPDPVTTKKQVFQKYLEGLEFLYLRVAIKTPFDKYFDNSTGQFEFVKLYARLAPGEYGTVPGQPKIIWVKLLGTQRKNAGTGTLSPIVKATMEFLRNQVPSKVFPNSQFPTDNIDVKTFVSAFLGSVNSFRELTKGFIELFKDKGLGKQFLPGKSFVRLNTPSYSKLGGGYRVKRIEIYDQWNKMTGGKESVYGQEYLYTTTRKVDGKEVLISSGVATYEPNIGGEENPFRIPYETYDDQRNLLGPVNTVFSEGPLLEAFYPSASVGYSKVRVRSIRSKNIRSQIGFEESEYFTAYDYPVSTLDEYTPLVDGFIKYESPLRKILKVNSKRLLAFSQGFKVETNDMHGKLKSQSSYAYGDSVHPYARKSYYYKSDTVNGAYQLNNTVLGVDRLGNVQSEVLGRSVELMTDARMQRSVMQSAGVNTNFHFFHVGIFPVFLPAFIKLPQFDQTEFKALAVTKLVNKIGILDSVVVMDKGSIVSTKNLVFDKASGNVVVTRTNNEFNDPVYNLNLPAYWAYDRMGPAYLNDNVVLNNVAIASGRIAASLEQFFVPGDEVLVYSKQQLRKTRLWAVKVAADTSNKTYIDPVYNTPGNGPTYSGLVFVDSVGKPFDIADFGYAPAWVPDFFSAVDMQVVRSGRRNQLAESIGSLTTQLNPVVNGKLTFDSSLKILSASARELKEDWKGNNAYWLTDNCNPVVTCPDGFVYNPNTQLCERILDSTFYDNTTNTSQLERTRNYAYGWWGVKLFKETNNNVWLDPSKYSLIHTQSPFWTNLSPQNENKGRLNIIGVWSNSGIPINTYTGFAAKVQVPQTKTYYVGLAADNFVRLRIDCNKLIDGKDYLAQSGNDPSNFHYWHIFPILLTKGEHVIEVAGLNSGSVASFGAEIYDNTEQEIRDFNSDTSFGKAPLNIIFSTADKTSLKFHFVDTAISGGSISAPAPLAVYSSLSEPCLTPINEFLRISRRVDTRPAAVTTSTPRVDTMRYINPYRLGLLGNYRGFKDYIFYNSRKETNPGTNTNIRSDGALAGFQYFWKFSGGWLTPASAANWIVSNEATLYDRKGAAVESRDALGRYVSGQFGYANALPTSQVQNSRYREAAFDGFEDYNYRTLICNGNCEKRIQRHFDWSAYRAKISLEKSHSGLMALRLMQGDSAVFTGAAVDKSVDNSKVWLRATNEGFVKTNSNSTFPVFGPTRGDSVLVSVWVSESQQCISGTYSNSEVAVQMMASNGTNLGKTNLLSSSPIIEGWQLFQSTVVIPTNADSIKVVLKVNGSGSIAGYFDDLRIHPILANMKSYVYEPNNLRPVAELDENNFATFYEYDDDGSLMRVKKETERGILTISESHSNIQIAYESAAISEQVQRNNCSPGYKGGFVIYELQEGAFTSTVSQEHADQLARNYVTANKQQYANSQGSCLPDVPVSVDNQTAERFVMTLTDQGGIISTYDIKGSVTDPRFSIIKPGSYSIKISGPQGTTSSLTMVVNGIQFGGNSVNLSSLVVSNTLSVQIAYSASNYEMLENSATITLTHSNLLLSANKSQVSGNMIFYTKVSMLASVGGLGYKVATVPLACAPFSQKSTTVSLNTPLGTSATLTFMKNGEVYFKPVGSDIASGVLVQINALNISR